MPLYDYDCPACSAQFEAIQRIAERKWAACPKCDTQAPLVVRPGKAPGLSLFKPGWWRDLDFHPTYVATPQQLRDISDRNNVDTGYLKDGIWKTSPGPDPEKR